MDLLSAYIKEQKQNILLRDDILIYKRPIFIKHKQIATLWAAWG